VKFQACRIMGSQSSKPAEPVVPSLPVEAPTSSGSACPVKHTRDSNPATTGSACPIPHRKPDVESKPAAESACPVKHSDGKAYKNPSVFNVCCLQQYSEKFLPRLTVSPLSDHRLQVYSTKIDPTNQMPANANQKPAPNQQAPLSVERVPSSIPKGGTDQETWTYPSPQMVSDTICSYDIIDMSCSK